HENLFPRAPLAVVLCRLCPPAGGVGRAVLDRLAAPRAGGALGNPPRPVTGRGPRRARRHSRRSGGRAGAPGVIAMELASASTPAAALVAGLVTSLHCAGMCGPLACLVAPTRGAAAAGSAPTASVVYHVSRLAGYTLLG